MGPKTVLKLGGSLLSLPDLTARLSHLLDSLATNVLLVPGGGGTADIIRRLDSRYRLPMTDSHAAAIAAMSFNACLLARTTGLFRAVSTQAELDAVSGTQKSPILDVSAWLHHGEAERTRALPDSWDVTSDSIAACVAADFGITRLILIKSCNPQSSRVQELSDAGGIDSWFPRVAGNLQIQWCNLRDASLRLCSIEVD